MQKKKGLRKLSLPAGWPKVLPGMEKQLKNISKLMHWRRWRWAASIIVVPVSGKKIEGKPVKGFNELRWGNNFITEKEHDRNSNKIESIKRNVTDLLKNFSPTSLYINSLGILNSRNTK